MQQQVVGALSLLVALIATTIPGVSSKENTAVMPAPRDPISDIYIRLHGIPERCLIEDLPAKTVLLVKHSATPWSTQGNQRVDASLQLLTTVRDPNGHTIVRQQSKPQDRLFLTATATGNHLICFQAMLTQYSPNIYVKLGLEVFIGDAGDPHITSPVEAQLGDLAFQIGKTADQAADLQREQTLQRDREQHFRSRSDQVNGKVLRWALLQAIVLAVTAWMQVHHLRRFFRYKKLV